ncbi:Hypothetical_protein [Hexamita inflata]|uniref:Hypothetical_protein n=1 Tax=Hexamita inflata TaxID=28002 RepID=A0ABP1K3H3_9EUKA
MNVYTSFISQLQLTKQSLIRKRKTSHVNYVYTGHSFSLIIIFPFLSKPKITKKPTTFLSYQISRTALSHVKPPHRLSIENYQYFLVILVQGAFLRDFACPNTLKRAKTVRVLLQMTPDIFFQRHFQRHVQTRLQ